jgi:hypothetical protein
MAARFPAPTGWRRALPGRSLAALRGAPLPLIDPVRLHQAFLVGSSYELEMFGQITTRLFEHIRTRFYESTNIKKLIALIYGIIFLLLARNAPVQAQPRDQVQRLV